MRRTEAGDTGTPLHATVNRCHIRKDMFVKDKDGQMAGDA